MIICLRQNEGQFRRFARKFSILLKYSGKFWSSFFKRLRILKAEPWAALRWVRNTLLRFKQATPRRLLRRRCTYFNGNSCGFPKENGGVSREARVATCRRQVLSLLHPARPLRARFSIEFFPTAGSYRKFCAYTIPTTISDNSTYYKSGPIPHPLPVNREGESMFTSLFVQLSWLH